MEQFGQYRLEELIGRGGMGEVYRAFDTVRGRVVALKRLPAHLAADEEFQARFRKESALASRLSEPHIIPIHDFGEIDGRLFIDMRLVDGRDLAEVIAQDGPMSAQRAAAMVAQVASALDAAHADGLVHRDVKPSNVLLSGDARREFVYLVDFGIARTVGANADQPLTLTGTTVGTLDYMAPERFVGTGVDHRADVYSLACVLFEAVTGRKPFRGEGIPAMIHAHLNVDAPLPSRERPAVPPALDAVVAKGMAKNPDERFPTAGALADAALAATDSRASPEPATVVVGPSTTRPTDAITLTPGMNVAPHPPGHTMLGLPSAGFGPPEDPAGAPPTGRRRVWAWVAGAVLVVAVVATVVVLLVRGAGPGTTPVAEPVAPITTPGVTTSAAAPTTTAQAVARPASLPDGDSAADAALWADLRSGNGIDLGTCAFTASQSPSRSYLRCGAVEPVLANPVGVEGYASPTGALGHIDGYYTQTVLTGNPGSCATGGKFRGVLAGRDVSCGYVNSMYTIVWTEPGRSLFVEISDPEPAKVWQWFSVHDPF